MNSNIIYSLLKRALIWMYYKKDKKEIRINWIVY